MNISIHTRVDFDRLFVTLFCLYGFLVPFELILEIIFGIDTIFKPFRIVSLLIIGLYGLKILKTGIQLQLNERTDIFLYLIFIYGLIISFIRMITGVFDMGMFRNELFQTGLYLGCYFIFKATPMNSKQVLRIFQCFIVGVFLNCSKIFFDYNILNIQDRLAGFSDNPNYTALSIICVMIYLLLRKVKNNSIKAPLLNGLLMLFFIYILMITGSRSAFGLLVIIFLISFYFGSLKRKITLVAISILIGAIIIPQTWRTDNLGGSLIMLRRVSQDLSSQESDVRFTIWNGTLNALENHGYFGLGIGQFKANFVSFFGGETNKFILEIVSRDYFVSTHNDALAVLTDYGLPGLLFFLIFYFLNVRRSWLSVSHSPRSNEDRILARMSFAIIICLIAFGVFAENFLHQLFWFQLMIATKIPRTAHVFQD